jgi:hypothetical protein
MTKRDLDRAVAQFEEVVKRAKVGLDTVMLLFKHRCEEMKQELEARKK